MQTTRSQRLELLRTIPRFKGRRVFVIGDLMLDEYIRGTVSRISPEAPVPVVRVTSETRIPGGAGNVVSNLAALGAEVSVAGVVGDDDAGRALLDILSARGVDTDAVVIDDGRRTTQKCRVVAERQQAVRYDRETEGALSAKTLSSLMTALAAKLSRAEAVILSDYGKGIVIPRVIKNVLTQSRRRRVPVTVDPKPEHFNFYRGVTCVTPNTAEAWACMHRAPQSGDEAIRTLAREIQRTLRSDSVLITRGADGMDLTESNSRFTHIPARAREVFDVSGAGDTVISTLTLALAAGAGVRNAAALANLAAGIVVGKLGTATVEPAELIEALQ